MKQNFVNDSIVVRQMDKSKPKGDYREKGYSLNNKSLVRSERLIPVSDIVQGLMVHSVNKVLD